MQCKINGFIIVNITKQIPVMGNKYRGFHLSAFYLLSLYVRKKTWIALITILILNGQGKVVHGHVEMCSIRFQCLITILVIEVDSKEVSDGSTCCESIIFLTILCPSTVQQASQD